MPQSGRATPGVAPTPRAPTSTAPSRHDDVRTFIDELLEEQSRLQTPVAAFARAHETTPALAPVYRDLIPLTRPGPDEQYAFEVDLDACSGCKACVAGCNSLNGLDDTETWRDVGLLVGGDTNGHAYQQTVTTACHHCADPGCLNGCPVLAYDKDPLTGIVRHLDDQCIGCSYCILKCPYDVPKFNERLGIVRKCDMCHGRLAEDQAPACVQSCPTQAIRIVKVSVSKAEPRASVDTSSFLAAAPSADATLPTTRYVSARGVPASARPADEPLPSPQPAHTPLAVLLVASQLALGLQFGGAAVAGAGLLTLGLAASALHLGQPLRAWRVFLGLRRSWLSREAVLFGAWHAMLMLSLVLQHLPFSTSGMELAHSAFLGASLVLGAAGVFASVMIYADTPRKHWRLRSTLPRFAGTVAVGLAFASGPLAMLCACAAKLLCEGLILLDAPAATRRNLAGPLRAPATLRLAAGVLALAFAGLALAGVAPAVLLWLAVGAALAGELLERSLFFRAVDPSAMPGQPAQARRA